MECVCLKVEYIVLCFCRTILQKSLHQIKEDLALTFVCHLSHEKWFALASVFRNEAVRSTSRVQCPINVRVFYLNFTLRALLLLRASVAQFTRLLIGCSIHTSIDQSHDLHISQGFFLFEKLIFVNCSNKVIFFSKYHSSILSIEIESFECFTLPRGCVFDSWYFFTLA